MLYAALTLWMFVIVFSAWAVHHLWSRLVQPRVVNTTLLPGTLVSQLGHILGLLITGQPVRNAALMGDDDAGAPRADPPEKPRIPIAGPIITALLPLVACAGGLVLASRWIGGPVVRSFAVSETVEVARGLPTSLPAFWALLRSTLTTAESVLGAIVHADWTTWPAPLFVYLAICLTVRMTPLEENRRGAIGAIALSGLVIGLLAQVIPGVESGVLASWPTLSFVVGMLLSLLILTLLISALASLARILVKEK